MEDYANIAAQLGADNHAFASKTVLLAGSQGFLGRLYQEYFRYLNERVLSQPCRLICTDLRRDFDNPNYFAADITDPALFTEDLRILTSNLDYIINAAGLASPKAYSTWPKETVRVSVQGTETILDVACDWGVKSTLMFSSSEIYGNPSLLPTPENYLGGLDAFCERGCYDVSKLQLENLCYIANTRDKVNVKVVRPFNVVGPIAGSDGRVIPAQVERLLRGEKMRVFLPGDQTRTFCWWTDFVTGSIKVLLHGDNRPYNLGNPANTISMFELAKKLEAIAGVSDAIELIPPSQVYLTEPMRRVPDISRARGLGYEPKVTLDEALGKFWGWAKENYPKS